MAYHLGTVAPGSLLQSRGITWTAGSSALAARTGKGVACARPLSTGPGWLRWPVCTCVERVRSALHSPAFRIAAGLKWGYRPPSSETCQRPR